MRTLYVALIASLTLFGCSGDDGGDASNTATGGTAGAADAGSMGGGAGGAGGGMGGAGGESRGGAGGGGGMAAGGSGGEIGGGMGGAGGEGTDGPFVDPDEGDPMPYQLPAALNMAPNDADPGPSRGCSASTISMVRGWVVDRIGRPVANAMTQLCIVGGEGTLNCLQPEESREDGTFMMPVSEDYRCISSATFRIVKPGSGRAPMYCKINLAEQGADTRLTITDPFVMYAGIPATDLPPLGDERMSRAVTFAAGFVLNVVPWDLVSDYTELGMRKVGTDERGLCFLEGAETPDHLYAFTPDSTIYGESTFSFPNEDGLAPGTTVDAYILGGLGCENGDEHIEEGAWTTIGTATVSEDGSAIVADEGTALTCLTWIGYKTRQ